MNSSGNTVTYGAGCTRDTRIKYTTDMAKASLNKNEVFLNNKLELCLRKKLVQCYSLCEAVCGDGIGRVGRVVR
jgi:hypothetical protein